MTQNQDDNKQPDMTSKQSPEKAKESNAVFERRSIVFGPGDAEMLDDLVRVAVFNKWPSPNRSTVIRSLIHIAAQAYQGEVFPRPEAWAHHLHESLPKELDRIKDSGAKRGPR